jgi:GH35 family endo-1,4-beta-xylanase
MQNGSSQPTDCAGEVAGTQSSNVHTGYFATGTSRREWLMSVAALGVSSQILSAATSGPLSVRAFEPDGKPCDPRYLQTLMLTDKTGRPHELTPKAVEAGKATIDLPAEKFELAMILPVKDFGSVYLYSDDGGGLYASESRELVLNYEFARSRAAFVRRYVKAAQASGVVYSKAMLDRLDRGEQALQRATEAKDLEARVRHSNDSLAETMWAGELAALDRAHYRISRQGARPGFLVGAYSYPFAKSEEHRRLFTDLFNEMTLALYRRGTDKPYFRPGVEREEGKPDYSLADWTLGKIADTNITVKGHPLVWFALPGLPEFLRTKTWDGVKQSCREHVFRTVGRYKSRIHFWDVMNEANDTANLLGYTHAQLLELTRLGAEATRAADPTACRVVNANTTWSEYILSRHTPDGAKMWSAFNYFTAVKEAGISYEALGLQLYNPKRDMLEIERQVERFFVFGKPVHITELGVSSSSEPDPRTQVPPSPDVWHGTRWTEQVQADWVEQFYTLCYSKPEIDAVIWWNVSDPSLYANSGLLTDDLRPKESYHRLLGLVKSWRAQSAR